MADVASVDAGNSAGPLPGLPTIADSASIPGMGKQEFLNLLIAQLKYQDPLQPTSNQEYAAQLAQFSQLEQLQNMNDSLNENLNINLVLTQSINNTLSSTIIGKDVKAYGNAVSVVDGSQAEINFKLADYADKVHIAISNEDGDVIRTIEASGMAAGEQSITWDGLDQDGNQVSDGNYTFEVTAQKEDNSDIDVQSYIYGFVSAVRYENGAAIFRVNGEDVPFSQVLEIGTKDKG